MCIGASILTCGSVGVGVAFESNGGGGGGGSSSICLLFEVVLRLEFVKAC